MGNWRSVFADHEAWAPILYILHTLQNRWEKFVFLFIAQGEKFFFQLIVKFN